MLFENLDNRVFDDRVTAFLPQEPQSLPGASFFDRTVLDTGAKVQHSGDVQFGWYAPNAQEVSVVFGIRGDAPVPMEKGADGVWRMTLKYDPLFCGPKAFWFLVDGAECISTYCPIYYSHSKAVNYVEIPDPNEDFVLMRDVPHGGVTTEYYWSAALNDWHRCLVYTPPMYQEGGEYPVLYLQHGAGENETSWVYNGRANHIMDNLIADGKAVPFLIVMNDGMARKKGETGFGSPGLGEPLMQDCIPFIEKKYHVKKDKWNRAIAGFSMGSMQASMVGLGNTDTFAYIGLFSGFMRMIGPFAAGGDILKVNPHLAILTEPERFRKEVKLYYRGIGSADAHYATFAEDDGVCADYGWDKYPNLVRNVVEGYPHDWAVMRILLHDFAQRLFRG